jgi:hypothetical protein
MFEIASNLLSHELLMKYEQNFTLITVFFISFIIFKFILRDPINREEQNRRRERAEVYLNKYKNVDEDFFNGNFTEELMAN